MIAGQLFVFLFCLRSIYIHLEGLFARANAILHRYLHGGCLISEVSTQLEPCLFGLELLHSRQTLFHEPQSTSSNGIDNIRPPKSAVKKNRSVKPT